MKQRTCICLAAMGLGWLMPELAQAQPMRQLPGVRPFLAGQMGQQPPPNSRRRPAASQVGLESTDFYPKNGYPKQLGDFFESGTVTTGGAGTAGTAGTGTAGNNGNTGVQSAGSMGFQGNTGNQIGQNGGGTILGGLFGGNNFNNQGLNIQGTGNGLSLTGGGFSGLVPKGFGFGGTPEWRLEWKSPLQGVTGR